ncbi:MAG: phosphoenolpyruvate mutase, partial [Rhodospirillales bacterium]|nr:phosphoenolpyruvate mutase [Rhodospirillales bacterium]
GLAKLSATGAEIVRQELAAMKSDGSLKTASLVDLFTRLLSNGQDIKVVYITGHWLDIDNPADLADAQNFL